MPLCPEVRPDAAVRLLLIESGRSSLDGLAEALRRRLAVAPEVIVASGGRQAAETLRGGRFDVVLMDLSSLCDLAAPAEAVARLVKLAEGALTLALSDEASVSATVEVMRAGAHDCVARPADAEALASRIAELSRRHGSERLRGEADGRGGSVSLEAARRMAEPRLTLHRSPILPMWQQEQRIIEEAIASFSGNIALAAQALELSPSTIYRKRQLWAEAEDKRGAA